MTKQLLIYEDAKPLSKERHGDWSVRSVADWRFAAGLNSVPLLVSEFAAAARHYPIVFSGTAERMVPIAVLGIRTGENSYVQDDGTWSAPYVPAFLRQYPYVFAKTEDEATLLLCIDEAYGGINTEGKGERLFDSDGARTGYLDAKLEFSKAYQARYRASERFATHLHELGVLEPMQAQVRMDGEAGETLSGFFSVTRKALDALDDEAWLRLRRNGMLEAIYTQLLSIGNFDEIVASLQARRLAA